MKRAAAFCLLVGCEQLTGVADLEVGEETPRSQTRPRDSDPDATTPIDATIAPPDAGQDSEPIDTGIDTTPPACTALPTNEAFPAAVGAPWLLRGMSAAANPGVRLTPSAGGAAGALYWDAPFTFDRFDISFSYAITTDAASTSGPGDGMTFAWISAATAPDVVATPGGGLGVLALTGWGVAIDVYPNVEYGDQPTPNISIRNTVDMTTVAATAANAALIDGNTHLVRVRLANGSVTVSLDGADVLGPTALPNYVAYSGYFGFGAATGGAFEEHKVVSVSARIGTTGPCAALP